jgi:hypothetical protein
MAQIAGTQYADWHGPLYHESEFSTIFKKSIFPRLFFLVEKEQLSDASNRGKPVIGKITWLICLPRIRQGPGRLFLLLLIAAQE